MTTMKFYSYRQNNTGGSFIYSKNEYGRYVFIEATQDYLADVIAQYNGVYFNGVENGRDCECCGDRWDSATEYDSFSNVEELKNEIKNILLDTYYQQDEEDFDEEKPLIVIHFNDNKVVNIYSLFINTSKEEKELKIKQILEGF